MKAIRQTGIVGMCLFFVLSIAIYSLQIGTARGDFEVSKRQDFATDDTTFHTNEDIYIKIGIDQAPKLDPGTARLLVRIKQSGKIRFKRLVVLTVQGDKTEVSYRDDIQPLFTQNRAWFDNPVLASFACGTCHYCNDEPPCYHAMNLTTHAGMLAGADVESGCGEPILGQSSCGSTDYNWDESVLRWRLRNNRMPPGSPFELDESNRNGPDVSTTNDGDDLPLSGSDFFIKRDASGNYEYSCCDAPNPNAVGLIGAWVEGTKAGLHEENVVPYGGDADVTWSDVAPFFTQRDTWFFGSLACNFCHFCNEEPPCYHAMNLTSAAGLRNGADFDGSEGEPILGQSAFGATDFNWNDESVLRKRLRNNRMPPTSPFVLDESNRDGRTIFDALHPTGISAVDLIGEWVGAGCPDN